MGNKINPLILVFYLDKNNFTDANGTIIKEFAKSVDEIIRVKNLNAVAFFLGTDGEERVECINPVIESEETMSKVDILLSDIRKQFNLDDK